MFLVLLSSCSALLLTGPGRISRPTVRVLTVTLQEEGRSSARYDEAEERGRAALEALQAETQEAEKKQKAMNDMASDAKGAAFNPFAALAALLAGGALGYFVQLNT